MYLLFVIPAIQILFYLGTLFAQIGRDEEAHDDEHNDNAYSSLSCLQQAD